MEEVVCIQGGSLARGIANIFPSVSSVPKLSTSTDVADRAWYSTTNKTTSQTNTYPWSSFGGLCNGAVTAPGQGYLNNLHIWGRGPPTGAIAGGVIGGVADLAATAAGIQMLSRRCRRGASTRGKQEASVGRHKSPTMGADGGPPKQGQGCFAQ
ncbi:hypothetical protein HOY82DRAFT_598015 [Tuber indicum]|nr:hypothetical protein HOY82DRAFT_598015 [Tuber indicum]